MQDSIGYNIDSKNDYPDIIDAHEMKCHIESLSRKFPETQCALVVVGVPTDSEFLSDPNRSSGSVYVQPRYYSSLIFTLGKLL